MGVWKAPPRSWTSRYSRGEPLYVGRARGEPVRSGVVNAGGAFGLRATATEQDITYAGIVRLAQQAGAESASVVRLADRYAAWFLSLSLAVAGTAWLVSGSATRAVAVFVVATPCPLLLAASVAVVSRLSRRAVEPVPAAHRTAPLGHRDRCAYRLDSGVRARGRGSG